MIGILSDTHENITAIDRAVEKFKQYSPELVVHCGDIISPPVLKCFAGLNMQFIFGNNDGEREGLQKMCTELRFAPPVDQLEFEVEGKSFYAYHGTKERVLEERIKLQKYDYILCGHTHETRDEQLGRTRVINPGALFLCKQYTIAVLEPASGNLELLEIAKKA